MRSASSIIIALEIGTSKVVATVGELDGHSVNIIGFGRTTSKGIMKGEAVDIRSASACAHAAIQAAEDQAGVTGDQVFLAISGGHVRGELHSLTHQVGRAGRPVSDEEVDSIRTLAGDCRVSEGRTIIQQTPRPFLLDGRLVRDPVHHEGRALTAGYWILTGDQTQVSEMLHLVNNFRLEVREILHAGLASGIMVTTAEERESGVMVLDIGQGTTDFAVYRHGACYLAGTLPVGGDHLTNDLSIGLRLNRAQAEKIKLTYGRAQAGPRVKDDLVWLDGDLSIGDRRLPRHSIETILELRVAELFSIIGKEVGEEVPLGQLDAGVILTGGSSRLPGIEDAASSVFGIQARRGHNFMYDGDSELGSPEFSTVLGLLYYGVSTLPEETASPGLFGRMKRAFRGLLPAS